MKSNPVEAPKQKRSFNPAKVVMVALAGIIIFQLGVGVGRGNVTLGSLGGAPKSENKNLPNDLNYATVEQVYDALRTNYDGKLSQTQLLDGLKEGLAKSTGDPYTEYFNPDAAKEFDGELNGTFTGIGAELSKDAQDNIVIIAPISGFPAEKAGLKPKDIIIEIDGKSTSGLTISEAVKLIRGPENTTVKLKVVRGDKPIDVEITRAKITIPSVTSEITADNIGYLKISRYAEDTSELAAQAADKFKAAGVKGVILDVRGDPGGLLTAAIDVSSLWLPKDKTVLQEKRDGIVVRTYKSTGTATLQGIPTIVLIDGGSASASEITAGALHDNNVAQLLGEKSYGKGSVQTVNRLGDGSIIKITVARWFTPGDKNIDKEGIKPDTEIKRTDDDFKNQRDPQKDKAVELLKK